MGLILGELGKWPEIWWPFFDHWRWRPFWFLNHNLLVSPVIQQNVTLMDGDGRRQSFRLVILIWTSPKIYIKKIVAEFFRSLFGSFLRLLDLLIFDVWTCVSLEKWNWPLASAFVAAKRFRACLITMDEFWFTVKRKYLLLSLLYILDEPTFFWKKRLDRLVQLFWTPCVWLAQN